VDGEISPHHPPPFQITEKPAIPSNVGSRCFDGAGFYACFYRQPALLRMRLKCCAGTQTRLVRDLFEKTS